MKKIPLIVVCGPTASGKTSLAIDIARELNTEIISADSIQIYKGLEIISAAPTEEEKALIPHHLINFKDISEEYSVGEFTSDAKKVIEKIVKNKKIPIICGGTGLYISSLINGIDFSQDSTDPSFRKELESRSSEELYSELLKEDPEAANWIHPNNTVRVIRALEIIKTTGSTFSQYRKDAAKNESPYDALIFFLNTRDRNVLYSRINERVDRMMAKGMHSEAMSALKKNPSKTALSAIGLKEFSLGDNLDSIISNIKQGTRHYAKRQITWFSRMENTCTLYLEDFSNKQSLSDYCITKIKEKFDCE